MKSVFQFLYSIRFRCVCQRPSSRRGSGPAPQLLKGSPGGARAAQPLLLLALEFLLLPPLLLLLGRSVIALARLLRPLGGLLEQRHRNEATDPAESERRQQPTAAFPGLFFRHEAFLHVGPHPGHRGRMSSTLGRDGGG